MFVELHCKSHYSFLSGASSPEQLVYQAAELGYSALAITDECSYAGIVKAYKASEDCGLKLIVGSEFRVDTETESLKLVLLAPSNRAYSEISGLITMARRRSPKGEYRLSISDLQFGLQHCLALWLPCSSKHDHRHGVQLSRFFNQRLWIGVELFLLSNDQQTYLRCEQLSRALDLPMVACNDVHMHHKNGKPLQDTLTAIRLNTTVQKLAKSRQINAERYLKPHPLLQRQYPAELLKESVRIADLCTFSMNELRYEYPKEVVPVGHTPTQYLRTLTEYGVTVRWPDGISNKMHAQIEHELNVIEQLEYEYYFLTVYDIVRFARSENILCQGRGSAANSAVCYCLFITEIDPNLHQLLFERFISKERNEPPDIDVDFESQRREEVIQYIYKKYSRKRTALTATVITYRRKSAVRDVGKALGLPLNFIEELNGSMAWWDKVDTLTEQMKARKLSVDSSLANHFFRLVKEILGTPRHLSQHVGGFLITHSPTSTLVPIENAAMPDRTIIQWDKYDIEIMGLLKVDVLGLGMLSAIRRSLTMISKYQKKTVSIQDIPKEDKGVYDMLCQGDSLGVFQVESRAQMSMLPRLKPRTFYDLVIQVAIVRPGPIQGDMVHPYLKRRSGEEQFTYPNDEIKTVLERTLGVPIFQEQVIKLTMVAAGFTGGEADELRRAMASWGKHGSLDQFRDKLLNGMLARGHSADFAERIFRQVQGFGSYGFPESHSASFALLVYISSWLKCYHPAAFYAGILNSQPMGFYSPSQLVQDARRHNIRVLAVCILQSNWEHTLDFNGDKSSLRLGLRLVKGVSEKSALALMASRSKAPISSLNDVKARHIFNSNELVKLVNANAFATFHDNRRRAYWQALQIDDGFNTEDSDNPDFIAPMQAVESMVADYRSARGVSLDYHPMQLLRRKAPFSHCTLAKQLLTRGNKSLIQVAGVVTGRQRPGTASGVIFLTLEDETGNINVILWKNIQTRFRDQILTGRILYIKGNLEHKDGVAHVVAGYIEQHDNALPNLKSKSRDFH
jgi:error-prone DNA polymerase